MQRLSVMLAGALLPALAPPCSGAVPSQNLFPIAVSKNRTEGNSRYCGLYSLYFAAKSTGREIDLDKLIQPKYLTGSFGSSVLDIRNCCQTFNIPCRTFNQADYPDLWLLDGPALLLVKNHPDAQQANHWLLLLRADWTTAHVYDSEAGQLEMSPADLLSLWGGLGIAILPKDAESSAWLWDVVSVGSILALLAIGMIAVKLGASLRLVPRFAAIPFAVLALAILGHALSPWGFLRNPQAVMNVAHVHTAPVFDEINVAALPKSGQKNALIVDVRNVGQYVNEHIAGSLNIPIDGSYFKTKAIVDQLDPQTHIVLYCNSEDCGWAEHMATNSIFRKFNHVSVFRGGLYEYKMQGLPTESGLKSN